MKITTSYQVRTRAEALVRTFNSADLAVAYATEHDRGRGLVVYEVTTTERVLAVSKIRRLRCVGR